MGKKRIYQLAKELNISSKVVIDVARQKGFTVSNHMSTIGENEERQLRESLSQQRGKKAVKNNAPKNEHQKKDVQRQAPQAVINK